MLSEPFPSAGNFDQPGKQTAIHPVEKFQINSQQFFKHVAVYTITWEQQSATEKYLERQTESESQGFLEKIVVIKRNLGSCEGQ